MAWRRLAPIFLAGLLLPAHGAPADEHADDGVALLDFFRQRTVHATPAELRRLVEQLGDDSFDVREQASQQLTAIGGPALPALARAAVSPDAEVRRRAEECRRQIDAAPDGPEVREAARRLSEAKPAGAAAILLDYLPARADEPTAAALRSALAVVAVRRGRTEPTVVRALADQSPARRMAAGVALCRAGVSEQLPAVRLLLSDVDLLVRLRVGLALADLGDREAVPALIALLDLLPRNLLDPVENLLYAAARADAPPLAMGSDAASRRKFRDAWADWWNKNSAAVDLVRAREPRYLDHTTVVLLERGRMIELDSDDRPVWVINDLGYPLDLQVLPGERVLVADYHGGRVVERHHDGTILWEKNVSGPLVAQRLPNGNTFIASAWQLIEVDRAGTVVFSYARPEGEEFMRAAKLSDGDIACVVRQLPRNRFFVRLDSAGREKRRFPVSVHTSGGRIDVRPDGRVLVPEMLENRVVEHDAVGRPLRVFSVDQPIAAVRLTNGNTLVTSMDEPRAVELDPAGKEVWQYRSDTKVNRAWRR
jgi:HEAT repeat protein